MRLAISPRCMLSALLSRRTTWATPESVRSTALVAQPVPHLVLLAQVLRLADLAQALVRYPARLLADY
jgi:hypothetical protein